MLLTQVPHFDQSTILVIGDVMLDRYWFGETSRISPEAPVPITKVNQITDRPGGASNVALNLKALGANVMLLGTIGRDEPGERLSSLLDAAQIEHHLITDPDHQTILKLRLVSRHQQLLRADFEKEHTTDHTDSLLTLFNTALEKVQLVILSDYGKGTLNQPAVFIQAAKQKGIPVLVDPKRTDIESYAGCTWLTPNFKEFEAMVGTCQTEEDIINKGRALLSEHHIESLLVTRGEKGMTLIDAEAVFHQPATTREVVDVTGAGDTVISTLGASLACNIAKQEAVMLANLAAGISVAKAGAATVTAPELALQLAQPISHPNTGIVNEAQLLQAVQSAKALGKKIVFTNGCFDILHAGHVICLQLAKQLGDYLIVAVNSDDSIRRLKGANRPINQAEHRMTVLAGLGVVDWVVPFDDDTPERLLALLQPDKLVKGGEYREDQVVGADIVKSYGGTVHIVGDKISSSSNIIRQILDTHSGVTST